MNFHTGGDACIFDTELAHEPPHDAVDVPDEDSAAGLKHRSDAESQPAAKRCVVEVIKVAWLNDIATMGAGRPPHRRQGSAGQQRPIAGRPRLPHPGHHAHQARYMPHTVVA